MKTLGKVLKRMLAVFLVLVAVALTVATVVAIPLSNQYASMITMALGDSAFATKGGSNPQYYESEYETDEALAKAAKELCLEVEEEGMVLMKNENQALPLARNAKVSLFGESSVNLVYGGAGAGSVDTSKAGNLKESMEAAGFTVNKVLWDFYETGDASSYRKSVPNVMGGGEMAPHEAPQSLYTDEVKASYEDYSDAAIIVIGRTGSESVDLADEYLMLSEEEEALIRMVSNTFEKVVLLLNVSNAMDVSCLEKYDIDACLWTGPLGQEGVMAIGEALSGEINPSGHLVDTWAYDANSAPATINQGDYSFEGVTVRDQASYMVYAEGIYVGYLYYETRYEDVILGNEKASNYDYDSIVHFPFGYGLSYTEFAWSDYSVKEDGENFKVTVSVTNKGSVAGKDTVQIYAQSPYTDYDKANGVEKASVELVGYEKTSLLEPGQTEKVEIVVKKSDLTSYDARGYETYILEAGTYYLTAAGQSHQAVNNILATKGYEVEGDSAFVSSYEQEETDATSYAVAKTGNEITNQLASSDITYYDPDFVYLSRSNWEGTWPATYENGSWDAPEELLEALQIMDASHTLNPLAEQEMGNETGDTADTKLTMADMIGLEYDDPAWDTLLNQLSFDEMYEIVSHAGYGTLATQSIGLPGIIAKDGPAGISSTLAGGKQSCMAYPSAVVLASSWNQDLANRRGQMVGEESIHTGIATWYAPAMNIHRTAKSGRNFEYYSEDSYISGTMGQAEVKGFTDKGGIVTIKHFAINDQETNRIGGAMFLNEQSARQVYLLPFEMCVENGNANGIMVSMNRVGTDWSGANEGLMTNILRNEWGYEGFAITDQVSFSTFMYADLRSGIAKGTDLWLCTDSKLWDLTEDQITDEVKANVRLAVHRYLYVVANSNGMNGIDADTIVMNVMPFWQKLIFPLVAIILLIDVGAFWAARGLWNTKEERMRKKALKEEKKALKKAK